MNEDIEKFVKEILSIKKSSFKMAKNDAIHIMENKVKDINIIEKTLDRLLEYSYNDECMDYYYILNDYYYTINKENADFYKNILKM